MNPLSRLITPFRLCCPRCQRGKLFVNLLSMHEHCPECGMKLEPEAGFYLGSIYANYALTTLLMTSCYMLLVFVRGYSKDVVIGGCLVIAVLFPLWFFRYSRSIWLSLMYHVNSSDFTSFNAAHERTSQSASR